MSFYLSLRLQGLPLSEYFSDGVPSPHHLLVHGWLLLGMIPNVPYGKLCLQVRLRRMFFYIVGEGRATFSPFERSEKHEKRGSPIEEPLSFIFFCEDAIKPLPHSSLP